MVQLFDNQLFVINTVGVLNKRIFAPSKMAEIGPHGIRFNPTTKTTTARAPKATKPHMPNRKRMPKIQEIKNLVVPAPQLWYLSNGIPVYESNMGTQDILKLELVFFAGRPFERKRLASRSAAALIREGTTHHTSGDIAEMLDYYGGTLSLPISLDTSNVLLYSLTKYFDKLLPLVAEMLAEPTFPQDEIDAFIERNKQRLQVDMAKNDFVAYRRFTELLYTDQHPYGYNSYAETYNALTRQDIVTHFEENYTAGNCMIFLSGKTNQAVRDLMELHLSKAIRPGERRQVSIPIFDTSPCKVVEPIPDSVQQSIRIGGLLFNRLHEDYNGMYVLNTVLGGYFGSRLMANIREEKGYTYNIYSSHDAMLYGGYFYVGTEAGNEFVEPTIKEIYTEMQRLQAEPIDADEMTMVRNYLLGNLLTNLDGPFNVSEVIKTFVAEGLPISGFDDLAQTIKTITAADLQVLAQRYFNKEQMWEVIV